MGGGRGAFGSSMFTNTFRDPAGSWRRQALLAPWVGALGRYRTPDGHRRERPGRDGGVSGTGLHRAPACERPSRPGFPAQIPRFQNSWLVRRLHAGPGLGWAGGSESC